MSSPVYYVFANAKEQAQANANRDGIRWAVWSSSLGGNLTYRLVSEHDSGYMLLTHDAHYIAKPNYVTVNLSLSDADALTKLLSKKRKETKRAKS